MPAQKQEGESEREQKDDGLRLEWKLGFDARA